MITLLLLRVLHFENNLPCVLVKKYFGRRFPDSVIRGNTFLTGGLTSMLVILYSVVVD